MHDRKNVNTHHACTAVRRQTVYNLIHRLHMLKVASLEEEACRQSIGKGELKTILHDLKDRGLVYSPKPGFVVCVDE